MKTIPSPGLILAGGLFAMFVFAAGTSAQEKEKKLRKSDLPGAVRRTAERQSQGAAVKGYSTEIEEGKRIYEVEMMVNGHAKDVSIDQDRTVLGIEEQVAPDSLPAPVREALARKAGSGKILKVESLSKRGVLVAYEAQVRTGDKRSEIQVGPDGKELAHRE
jgi:hypothetical protein